MSTSTLAPTAFLPAVRTTAQPVVRRTTPPARGGQVRLTRRGRLVVLVLALLVVAAVAVALAAGSAASREDGGAPAVDLITVAPGDTLWDIAGSVAADSGDSIEDMMVEIRQLNTLEGGSVFAGQVLRIPSGE